MPNFHDLLLASVNQSAQGSKLVCCDGWKKQPDLELPPQISQNMEDFLRTHDFPGWMYKTGTFNQMTVTSFKNMCKNPLRFVTDASYHTGNLSTRSIV